MEIRNRLFPYPVLCDETDDYNEETCDVVSETVEGMNDIKIHIEFQLDNPEILDLIRQGYAEYAVHLECSTTSFRKLIRSDVSEIDYSIPKSRVNVEIAVLAMVIAKRRIENFSSSDLNEDYSGTTINFDKASILAYRNMPRIYVYKNYEELAGNESLFSIVKVGLPDDEEVKPLTFELGEERIKIMVDPKTYEAYIHFKQKPAIAMSMLVLPALIYAIDELQASPDSFSNCKWLIKMKQYYKAQKLDFKDEVIESDKNVVEIAQEMLKSPIGKAYRNLMEEET
ncbi:MAG: hypothetical protein LKG89_07005 [Lachnospiraceae bacterium]|jgi:hypothetical protein|nr:hypothetical protein [Lachnospiraceae bacterium]